MNLPFTGYLIKHLTFPGNMESWALIYTLFKGPRSQSWVLFGFSKDLGGRVLQN